MPPTRSGPNVNAAEAAEGSTSVDGDVAAKPARPTRAAPAAPVELEADPTPKGDRVLACNPMVDEFVIPLDGANGETITLTPVGVNVPAEYVEAVLAAAEANGHGLTDLTPQDTGDNGDTGTGSTGSTDSPSTDSPGSLGSDEQK